MAASKSPKLTQRNGTRMAGGKPIPKKKFALPNANGGKGAYPVDTPGRARDALSRAAANASPAEQRTIQAKVRATYPGIAVGGKKTSTKKTTTARPRRAAGRKG